MQGPSHNHQGIYSRNFLVLLLCLSFVAFIDFQINQATNNIQKLNEIVNAILRNQTYSVSSTELQNLRQFFKLKSYEQLSQSQCLVRLYFDVIENQKILAQLQTIEPEVKSWPWSYFDKENIFFNQLAFPTTMHDFKNFKNCSDIISMMNYLNENKVDLIYTTAMQQKHGILRQYQADKKQNSNKEVRFCLMVNQFNNSLTKLRSNLNSLIEQSYNNFNIIVLDNGSGDGSYEIAKVILGDLIQKESQQQPQNKAKIQDMYKVIKEPIHLTESSLYAKHHSLCENSDYTIFVDGRDQLVSRHVLNIISTSFHRAVNKPQMITGSVLHKKQLNRVYPLSEKILNQTSAQPVLTFKAVLSSLYDSLTQRILNQTASLTHPVLIQSKINEILFKEISSSSILEIDQILYVYDNIQNKQQDRNPYFIQIVKEQARKIKKSTGKN